MLELNVQERDTKKKPEALRGEGVLPAVFYGPKEEATPIAIDMKDFERVWKEAGETTIVSLKGAGDEKEALIYGVVTHPVTGDLQHADFYVFERGKKIEVSVPIEFVGEAPAEKAGHVVVKALYEVEISVRPRELPQHLEVDISKLEEVSDSITVADIALPESGEFVTDPEETVVIVKEAKEEEPEPQEGELVPESVLAEGEEGEVPAEEGDSQKEGEPGQSADKEAKKEE